MRIAKCKPKFTNVNCCAADAPLRNAAWANVRCGCAAWSNADEGGERSAVHPQRSFAQAASAAAQPQRSALLYYKLFSTRQIIGNVYHLLFPVENYLVYIDNSIIS